jgi:hypothetical protein
MPKYEHAVQVAEFSKDSLTQLKKAFAPSLESLFEARKAASDAGAESTAKKVGGTGIMAVLLRVFKRLAVVVGLVVAGLVALVSILGKPGDPKTLLGTFAGIRAFFRMKWIKMPEMKGFKESMANWKKGWNNFITNIKESKFATEVSTRWTAMMESLKVWRTNFRTWRANFAAKWITPLTEYFGDGTTETTETKDAKGKSRLKNFFKRLKLWSGWGLLGWLNRFVWPLWVALTLLDANSEWDKTGEEYDKVNGDPKTLLEKWKKKRLQLSAATDSVRLAINQLVVGTAGVAYHFLGTWLLPKLGLETDQFFTEEEKKMGSFKFGEMWGKNFQKWQDNMFKALEKWVTELFTFTWFTPDQWAIDFDQWMADQLNAFGKFLMDTIKNMWSNFYDPISRAKNQVTGKTYSQTTADDSANARAGNLPKGVKVNKVAMEQAAAQAAAAGTTEDDVGWLERLQRLLPRMPKVSGIDAKKAKELSSMLAGTVPETKRIGNDGGTTNMDGVQWNALSPFGRKGIEHVIRSIFNKHGASEPVFTSGLRGEGHPLYAKGSKHSDGYAFDLRSKSLGTKREAVGADLLRAFSGSGWFSQWEPARHYNTRTGTSATAEHFHFQKAAKGFFGTVDQPTVFLAGEAGPEDIMIQPRRDPSQQTTAMRNMGADVSFGMGGFGGGGGITTVVDASSSTNNSTVLAVGNGPHPAAIDDGLLHRG